MAETLTILGASARAAAQSAVRAGLAVVAGDLFADDDLIACSQATQIARWPHDLAHVCSGPQLGSWMYTGGLENWPELVEQMAVQRPLLGTGAAALRRVRDPVLLHQQAIQAGFLSPAVSCSPHGIPTNGSWLKKPRRSGGGLGIRRWRGADDAATEDPRTATSYFQQHVRGQAFSASYVATEGSAILLIIAKQLIDEGREQFLYAGSIGAIDVSEVVYERLSSVGEFLAKEFELQGLFGVDFVLAGEQVWLLEVNPRYTASMELIEHATGMSMVGVHYHACGSGVLPDRRVWPDFAKYVPLWGKRICYAPRQLTVSAELREWIDHKNAAADRPQFVDLPRVGSVIEAAAPLLTLFATGGDEREVERALDRTAKSLLARLQ